MRPSTVVDNWPCGGVKNNLRRRRGATAVILLVGVFGVSTGVLADADGNAADDQVFAECRWADGPIVIDGRGDEAAWSRSFLFERFTLPWLGDQSRPARTATRARLLWDWTHLYFFADMDDADLYADVTQQDDVTWENDVFELFFKPAENKPGYYEFQVNAAETKLDMFIPQRGAGGFRRFAADGRFHVEAKVVRRGTLNKWQDQDEGWSVEGRIPWTDFYRTGGRPASDEVWRFALCRYDYSIAFDGPELSTTAPLRSLNRPDFHHHEDYAPIRFVGPAESDSDRADGTDRRPAVDDAGRVAVGYGIERYTPWTTSRVVGSPEPPPPFRAEPAFPKWKLSWPIFVTAEPGSRRLFFIDQARSYGPARIGRTTDDPSSGEVETLVELDGVAYSLAFHPKYDENGFLYVGLNGPLSGGAKRSQVVRYTIDRRPPHKIAADSALTIIEWESDGHNGAAITFGRDGMLYVTSGDGTSDSDTNLTGQRMDLPLSKLMRIDVDHPDKDRPYSVPQDNPFVGDKGVRPETWAYGFRNPWRVTTDRRTGAIWVGNNGQDLWEQAYRVERGANYGWSVYEGSHPFYLNRKLGPTPHTPPTVEHPHSEARSLTGGVVYYGDRLPELRGAYVYGDYSTGKIWGAKHDGREVTWHKEIADTTFAISAIEVDGDGELLIADHRGDEQGAFYRLVPNEAPGYDPAAFPRRLSETGLFADVAAHRLQPAIIPYSVNSPLWSDGSHKERFIALPHVDPASEATESTEARNGKDASNVAATRSRPKITMKPTRGWEFPNGTVLVKSFAIELREGDESSRRWIETRLLTRQDNEWVGYSYEWNAEQTDAMLVPRDGTDREYSIQTAEGPRPQPWRFPSRTECMVCHSRAANYVLGLQTNQMNRDHDYGGVVDNQLRVLEHLGLLEVAGADDFAGELKKQLEADGLDKQAVDEAVAWFRSPKNQRGPRMNGGLLAKRPADYAKFADPYDEKAPIAERARSYLHANCAHCHVGAGGGNAQIDLDASTKLSDMKLIGERPLHDAFGIADARLVAPGLPESSVLLHRASVRGRGQMPQLATRRPDQPAVEMLRRWIREMEAGESSPPADAASEKDAAANGKKP